MRVNSLRGCKQGTVDAPHFRQLYKGSLGHFKVDERLTFLEKGTSKVECDVNDGILNRGGIIQLRQSSGGSS